MKTRSIKKKNIDIDNRLERAMTCVCLCVCGRAHACVDIVSSLMGSCPFGVLGPMGFGSARATRMYDSDWRNEAAVSSHASGLVTYLP